MTKPKQQRFAVSVDGKAMIDRNQQRIAHFTLASSVASAVARCNAEPDYARYFTWRKH